MKVTAIKAQVKNPNRVSVFVDGKYSFSLSLDQLLEQKLKKDIEIDEVRLKTLKKLSEDGKLKQRTLEWLHTRPHSKKELREYLFKKKAEKDLIEEWVLEFENKSYLDDEMFARWFAENRRRKNKSTRAISAELYSKGISSVTIKKITAELDKVGNDAKSEKEALQNLVNKLSNRPRYSDKDKLKRYLLSKGFNYSLIKEVVEKDN